MTPYRTQPPIPPPLTTMEKGVIAWGILKPGVMRVVRVIGIVCAVLVGLYGVGWTAARVVPDWHQPDWGAIGMIVGGGVVIFSIADGLAVIGACLTIVGMPLYAIGKWLHGRYSERLVAVRDAIAVKEEERKNSAKETL